MSQSQQPASNTSASGANGVSASSASSSFVVGGGSRVAAVATTAGSSSGGVVGGVALKDIVAAQGAVEEIMGRYAAKGDAFFTMASNTVTADPEIAKREQEELRSQESEVQSALDTLSDLTQRLRLNTNVSLTIQQHHQDKLNNLKSDFRRVKLKVKAATDRLELLHLSETQRTSDLSVDMELLIKERASIFNSSSIAEQLAAEGEEAKRMLGQQTSTMMGSRTKLTGMTAVVHSAGNLLGRIGWHKRKTCVILGLTIGSCIVFLLWWWLG
ncbi:golgi SNAP receptor complex member 1 [Pelomyxa schiedti]|nr:golgi SNAP receptor complex member 1 [Pelomyxa schiedti]